MKPIRSSPLGLLALLCAPMFGGGYTIRETPPAPRSTGFTPVRNTFPTKPKRRRKNPFRGTTYAAVIGVRSHC
jgi:hypothetical protein